METSLILERFQAVKKTASGWQARCPAHDDKTPSLSISQGDKGIVLHCHAGCTPESVCASLGLKLSDLFKANGQEHAGGSLLKSKPVSVFNWQKCVANFSEADTQKLAGQRGLSIEFVRWLHAQGVVGIFDGKTAFANHGDGGKVVSCHVRLEETDKWIFKPSGQPTAPLIFGEPKAAGYVMAFESQWDAFAVMDKLGWNTGEGLPDSAIFITRGAGNGKLIHGRVNSGGLAYAFTQNDQAGQKWLAEIVSNAGCRVVNVVTPATHKDSNDWTRAGATKADIEAAMKAAKPVALEDEKPGPWFELVQDGADIAVEVLPPVLQIVQDILPEECKLVIAGSAKSFKTWLALYAALSIAHGQPFLNKPTTRRRVLYCNLELRPVAFNRRVQIIGRALGIDIEREWFVHLPLRGKLAGLFPSEIVSRIIAIAKRLRAGVVVLDPTYKLLANAEENSSGAMTALFNEIDRLTTDAKCTVILCDHFSKGNKSEADPLDAIRGSSAKAGDVDAAMIIRPQETENCFSVDLIHRELPPVEPFVLEWDFPLMKVRDDLDAGKMRKAGGRGRTHTEETLLAALGNKSLTTTEWQKLAEDEHGIPRRTFYELKKILVSAERVIQSTTNSKWQKVNKTK